MRHNTPSQHHEIIWLVKCYLICCDLLISSPRGVVGKLKKVAGNRFNYRFFSSRRTRLVTRPKHSPKTKTTRMKTMPPERK